MNYFLSFIFSEWTEYKHKEGKLVAFQYQWKPEKTQKEVVGKKENIEPLKSDFARILHSPQEFVIDFFQGQELQSRILTPAGGIKAFYEKLKIEVEKYERENGQIILPKKKEESLISELKRNLYTSHKVSKNLRIINPSRKKSETRRKKQ